MNAHTARALFKDAFFQVLDNLVFRIFVILVLLLVAVTFFVGLRPEGLQLFFGWFEFTWEELLPSGSQIPKDVNVQIIQGIQSLFVDGLVGDVGIMLCLAATAFFVPRMLEKGEADTLFSKPVGRFTLLLARYTSGLVFVGILAIVLVFGMHLGFLLCSGYSDPGFLWGALTLVYVFALVHAFSTAMGVLTRSSVGALLLAILFFTSNGCSQRVWVGKEHAIEQQRLREAAREDDAAATKRETTPFVKTFLATWDGLRFVLPKTYDADVLTRKLRTAVSEDPAVVIDAAGQMEIGRDPAGLVREGSGRELDLSSTPALWVAEEGGKNAARVTVSRKSRLIERKTGDKVRTVRASSSTAASDLVKALEAADPSSKPARVRTTGDGLVRDRVTWTSRSPGGAVVAHQRAFLALDDWMYEIDLEADPAWLARNEGEELFDGFLAAFEPQRESALDLDSDEWYAARFDWTAPHEFNAFVSLGTSIAFAILMLLIARWRLARIDF